MEWLSGTGTSSVSRWATVGTHKKSIGALGALAPLVCGGTLIGPEPLDLGRLFVNRALKRARSQAPLTTTA